MTLRGWFQREMEKVDRSPPKVSWIARLVLLPGLAIRTGILIIAARLLHVDIQLQPVGGIEPIRTYPGLSPGPRRALAAALPYAVGLIIGWLTIGPLFLESRILTTPIFGGPPELLDLARDESWQVTAFLIVEDLFSGRGALAATTLWTGATAIVASAPRWREIDELRADIAASLPRGIAKVIDTILLVPRTIARILGVGGMELALGGLVLLILHVSMFTRLGDLLHPFA